MSRLARPLASRESRPRTGCQGYKRFKNNLGCSLPQLLGSLALHCVATRSPSVEPKPDSLGPYPDRLTSN